MAMTEKVRDKLVTSAFSFLLSVAVFVIGFWLTGMRVSSESINKKIDSKVDKEQYDRDCVAKEARMEAFEKSRNEQIMLLYTINSKLAGIETDLQWLKKQAK